MIQPTRFPSSISRQRLHVGRAGVTGAVVVLKHFAEREAHVLVEGPGGGVLRPTGGLRVEARAAHGPRTAFHLLLNLPPKAEALRLGTHNKFGVCPEWR